MSTLSFIVPGAPQGKGRARAVIRGGRIGHYTPDKTARYENLVAIMGKQAMAGRSPYAGPVELLIVARMAIAASWPKKRRTAALAGTIYPAKKPDLDNVAKSIKDGLNGIAWLDDAQVVSMSASKRYAAAPCVEVQVIFLPDG